jgi:hypothetical protein
MRIWSLGDLTGLVAAATANILFLYTTPFHNYGCSVLMNSTVQGRRGDGGGNNNHNNNSNFYGTVTTKIRPSLIPPSHLSNGLRRVFHAGKRLGSETDHTYPSNEEFKNV